MKNKKVKVLIVLVIILIILFAIVCITTDMFKSSKTLFYKYLVEGNMNNIEAITYDEILNNAQKKEGYDISGSVNLKLDGQAQTGITKLLKDVNINVDYTIQTDGNQNKYISLKEKKNSDDAIQVELVQNGTIVGLREKNIYDKYVSIDFSKMKETLEKMSEDTENVTNALKYDKYLLYYVSKEDRKTILNTYKKIIDKDIPSRKYSTEKTTIEVNGSNYKCNEYKLSITKVEFNKLCTDLLKELKDDDLTLNLIIEKYNLANLYKKDITKEELLKKIQKKIDDLEKNIPDDERIEIKVYENNSKTIRTEISNGYEKITIDTTKTRSELITLTKVDLRNTKFEVLCDFKKTSNNELESKIIYVQGKSTIKANITANVVKDKKEILKLTDKNSENLSDVSKGKIDEIKEEVEENINRLIENRVSDEELRNLWSLFILEGKLPKVEEENVQNPLENEDDNNEDQNTENDDRNEDEDNDESESENPERNETTDDNDDESGEETEDSNNNTVNQNNVVQNPIQNTVQNNVVTPVPNPLG